MNQQQAYQVLGVTPYDGMAEIQQAYQSRFCRLQAQAIPGQSQQVRDIAEQQLAELTDAYQFLMALMPPSFNVGSSSSPPPGIPSGSGKMAPSISNRAVAASFLLAAGMIVLVLGMIKCPLLISEFRQAATGDFRVLSVPWCQVALDGKDLGPSGQACSFTVPSGKHTVVLRQNQKTMTTVIDIQQDRRILLKADFRKGVIYVSSPQK